MLSNVAEFSGDRRLIGASAFFLQGPKGPIAATARHLLGSGGGVSPAVQPADLGRDLHFWRVFPRTIPALVAELRALDTLPVGDEDWLLLGVQPFQSPPPAITLRVRPAPVRVGEKVYLPACPYSEKMCVQNVYTGEVTARAPGNRFRFTLSPSANTTGFSGAPVLDAAGHVVGVMSPWFDPALDAGRAVEAGGEGPSPSVLRATSGG